jgi:hypothetical protein
VAVELHAMMLLMMINCLSERIRGQVQIHEGEGGNEGKKVINNNTQECDFNKHKSDFYT